MSESSPPVLTEVDALAQLSFRVQGLLERRANARGLSPAAARLLGVLRDRRPTMTELTRLLGLDKSSVTGLVDRAQRRGLVERVRSTSDGRSVRVALTEPGRALVGATATGFAEDVAMLLEPLGPAERHHLHEITSRLLLADAATRGIDLFDVADESAHPPV